VTARSCALNCIFATVGAAARLMVNEMLLTFWVANMFFFLSVIKVTIQVPTDIPSSPKHQER
jgi:hypothetical protein